MSRITTKWGKQVYAAIFTHNLKPSIINSLCRKYADNENLRNTPEEGSPEYKLRKDLILLGDAVETIQPVCTSEHQKSGLALLHNIAYTPRGRRRGTERAGQFSDHDLTVLANAREIAFVTINVTHNGFRASATPIFEVRSHSKGNFRYYYRAWQSGGGFEII